MLMCCVPFGRGGNEGGKGGGWVLRLSHKLSKTKRLCFTLHLCLLSLLS